MNKIKESKAIDKIVQLVDLQRQYQTLREEYLEAFDKVASQADFIGGPIVAEFENDFAALHGSCDVVGVSCGTDALHLALLALEVGPGDEVITVPNTWISSAFAADYVGANTVLVDIDPSTYQMDPKSLEAAITPRTKAVIPVHMYGHPAPMDTITKICRSRGDIKIVEDVAQAPLASLNGQLVGTFGDIACFSYYPSKNLGAFGDGGAILTRNPALAAKTRELAFYGQSKPHYHSSIGYNFRLDTLQAAILKIKLPYLKEWNEARRVAALRYDHLLAKLPVKSLKVQEGAKPVYHIYVIELNNRNEAITYLRERGVMAQIHYPNLIHHQPCYANLGYKDEDFPNAVSASKKLLSLPIFPEISDCEIDYVVENLKQFISENDG